MPGMNSGAMQLIGISLVLDGLARFQSGVTRFESMLNVTQRGITDIAHRQQALTRVLGGLGTASLMAGGAILASGLAAAKAAVGYEKLEIASKAIARNAGVTATALNQQTVALQKQQFTGVVALSTVNKLNAANASYVDMVRLGAIANDIATAKNMDAAQVLNQLSDSIAKASAESLNQLDIGIVNERLLQKMAATQKTSINLLTVAERRQAVYNYVLEKGTMFAGAFNETIGTGSYQLRKLSASWGTVVTGFGKGFLNAFSIPLAVINGFVSVLASLPQWLKNLIAYVTTAGGAVLGFFGIISIGSITIKKISTLVKYGIDLFKLWITGQWGANTATKANTVATEEQTAATAAETTAVTIANTQMEAQRLIVMQTAAANVANTDSIKKMSTAYAKLAKRAFEAAAAMNAANSSPGAGIPSLFGNPLQSVAGRAPDVSPIGNMMAASTEMRAAQILYNKQIMEFAVTEGQASLEALDLDRTMLTLMRNYDGYAQEIGTLSDLITNKAARLKFASILDVPIILNPSLMKNMENGIAKPILGQTVPLWGRTTGKGALQESIQLDPTFSAATLYDEMIHASGLRESYAKYGLAGVMEDAPHLRHELPGQGGGFSLNVPRPKVPGGLEGYDAALKELAYRKVTLMSEKSVINELVEIVKQKEVALKKLEKAAEASYLTYQTAINIENAAAGPGGVKGRRSPTAMSSVAYRKYSKANEAADRVSQELRDAQTELAESQRRKRENQRLLERQQEYVASQQLATGAGNIPLASRLATPEPKLTAEQIEEQLAVRATENAVKAKSELSMAEQNLTALLKKEEEAYVALNAVRQSGDKAALAKQTAKYDIAKSRVDVAREEESVARMVAYTAEEEAATIKAAQAKTTLIKKSSEYAQVQTKVSSAANKVALAEKTRMAAEQEVNNLDIARTRTMDAILASRVKERVLRKTGTQEELKLAKATTTGLKQVYDETTLQRVAAIQKEKDLSTAVAVTMEEERIAVLQKGVVAEELTDAQRVAAEAQMYAEQAAIRKAAYTTEVEENAAKNAAIIAQNQASIDAQAAKIVTMAKQIPNQIKGTLKGIGTVALGAGKWLLALAAAHPVITAIVAALGALLAAILLIRNATKQGLGITKEERDANYARYLSATAVSSKAYWASIVGIAKDGNEQLITESAVTSKYITDQIELYKGASQKIKQLRTKIWGPLATQDLTEKQTREVNIGMGVYGTDQSNLIDVSENNKAAKNALIEKAMQAYMNTVGKKTEKDIDRQRKALAIYIEKSNLKTAGDFYTLEAELLKMANQQAWSKIGNTLYNSARTGLGEYFKSIGVDTGTMFSEGFDEAVIASADAKLAAEYFDLFGEHIPAAVTRIKNSFANNFKEIVNDAPGIAQDFFETFSAAKPRPGLVEGIFDPLDSQASITWTSIVKTTEEEAKIMAEKVAMAVQEIQSQLAALDLQMRGLDDELVPLTNKIRLQEAANVPTRVGIARDTRKMDQEISDVEIQKRVAEAAQAPARIAISQTLRQADENLYPYQKAVQEATTRNGFLTIELEKQTRQLDAQARGIDESNRALDAWTRALDATLRPLEENIMRMEAASSLITIPLNRQLRELQRQQKDIQKTNDNIKKQHEEENRLIQDKIDALQKVMDKTKERLDVLKWESFIEETKNKILRKETSARAVSLKSLALITQDQYEEQQNQMDKLREQLDAQKKSQEEEEKLLEKQNELVDKQMQAIEDALAAEEEKLQYAREELEIAKAMQIEDRISIENARLVNELAQIGLDAARLAIEEQGRVSTEKLKDLEDRLKIEELSQSNMRFNEEHRLKMYDEELAKLDDKQKLLEAEQTARRILNEITTKAMDDNNLTLQEELDIQKASQEVQRVSIELDKTRLERASEMLTKNKTITDEALANIKTQSEAQKTAADAYEKNTETAGASVITSQDKLTAAFVAQTLIRQNATVDAVTATGTAVVNTIGKAVEDSNAIMGRQLEDHATTTSTAWDNMLFDPETGLVSMVQRAGTTMGEALAEASKGFEWPEVPDYVQKFLQGNYPGGANFDPTKAANGYNGVVRTPTMFLAGEAGAEQVDIRPLTRQVPATPGRSGVATINYITNNGPTVNMDATYAGSPSRRSVLSDLSLAAQLIQ